MKRTVLVVLVVVGVLLVPAGLSSSAQGAKKGGGGGGSGGYFYSYVPFPAGTTDSGTTCGLLCGAGEVLVPLSADKRTGTVLAGVSSESAGFLAAGAWAKAGFWGPTFKPEISGIYRIEYRWRIYDQVIMQAACYPGIGSGIAQGKIYIKGNILDTTNGHWAWVNNGDAGQMIYDWAVPCPVGAAYAEGYVWGTLDYRTAAALIAGGSYTFITYIWVAVATAGLGIGEASSSVRVNAVCNSMEASWTP